MDMHRDLMARERLRAHAIALGLDPDKAVELAETLARERPLTLAQAVERIERQFHARDRR